jgi:hypothetical protein
MIAVSDSHPIDAGIHYIASARTTKKISIPVFILVWAAIGAYHANNIYCCLRVVA